MLKFLVGLALVVSAVISVSPVANAAGFVHLANGRNLYVDFQKPEPGKPTLLLLNGLTYSTQQWDAFVAEFAGTGYGILRYDMMGQGQTLLKYAPVKDQIVFEDQITDLHLLLKALRVTEKIHVIGLSYGGAAAVKFASESPDQIASLIIMAPFDHAITSNDEWIRQQISWTRMTFPFNPASDDDLYDYFLKQLVYGTFPSAEPIVLENPYKLEAAFRLTQGIRRFTTSDVASLLPAHTVHLMVGTADQYIPAGDQEILWQSIPIKARVSRLLIDACTHKIPEVEPAFAASWVKLIVEGDTRIAGGATFKGTPWNNEAVSGSLRIPNVAGGRK